MYDDVLIKIAQENSKGLANRKSILYSEDLKIKKVAFDLFKIDNDPYDGLWQMQEIDGRKHLVRASDPKLDSASTGNWSAISNYDQTDVTLAYRGVPIARFSSKEYNFDPNDIITFKSALLERANSDQEFVKDVLANQPISKVEALSSTFPEFKKLF